MRSTLRAIVSRVLTTASLALLLLAAPKLEIPTGKEIRFDGRIAAGEWGDARKFETKDHDLYLKRTGPWLSLAVAGRRSYSGEIFQIVLSDPFGAWQTLYLGMIGLPAQPPALIFRGPRAQYLDVIGNAKIPLQVARGTLSRLRAFESGSWSAEYRIRLPLLGIGRGDLRAFKVRLVLSDGALGEGDVLVLPEGTTPQSEVAEFADLVSPDGWGAEERWDPVAPEASQEFDDAELLGLLALEQQEALRPGETGQLTISNVVLPRSRSGIARLRAALEAGRDRNPTLPAWHYFLGRLLHEANLYDDAGKVIASIPEPLLGFGGFAHLSAEHYADTEQPDKALEICRAHPRIYGIEQPFQRATAVRNMLAVDRRADQAARDAGAAALPIVRFETTQGAFEVELFEDEAPNAVANFIDLVMRRQYYDGIRIEQIQGNVAARIGDPRTRNEADAGPDGPPWRIKSDASSRAPLLGRLITVPAEGQGQHGSQFVLSLAPITRDLNGAAVFGRVVKGMDVVLSLEKGDRIVKATVVRKRSHNYDPAHSRLQ
jgi:peptidyl-prolyl cis-trans isomerase B (cyclophilin B)